MNKQCDRCGHDPDVLPVREQKSLQECDQCGQVLCEDCLTEMVGEAEMTSEEDVTMLRHPETGELWCPECWNANPERDN